MANDPFAVAAQPVPVSPQIDPFAAAAKPVIKQRVEGPKTGAPTPNLLRTIGEAIKAPASLAGAAWESIPALNSREHHDGNLADAWKTYTDAYHKTHDLGAAYAALNTKYMPSSDAAMAREGVDPKKVPLAMKVANEMATTWYSPGNTALGQAAGFAGNVAARGINAGRQASPVFNDSVQALLDGLVHPIGKVVTAVAKAPERAIGAALRPAANLAGSVFSRYSPLMQRGGKQYAEAGLRVDRAPGRADKAVENIADHIFKDTTAAQKRAILNLSYRDDRGNRAWTAPQGVPESNIDDYLASHGVTQPKTGMSLQQRADLYRASYNRITPLLQDHGIIDRSFNTGMYDPRRRFDDRPVFASQDAEESSPFVNNGTGSRLGIGNKTGGRKQETRPLYEIPDNEISPQFDPAHQFVRDMSDKRRALSGEIERQQLEKVYGKAPDGTPTAHYDLPGGAQPPAPARADVLVHNGDTFFGVGKEGVETLNELKRTEAMAKATRLTHANPAVIKDAANLDIPASEIGGAVGVNARIRRVESALDEAQNASKNADRLHTYVEQRYHDVQARVGNELLRVLNRQAAHVDKLNEALEKAQAQVTNGAGMARARQMTEMVAQRDREMARLKAVAARVEQKATAPFVQQAAKTSSQFARMKKRADALGKAVSEATVSGSDASIRKVMQSVADAGVDESADNALRTIKRSIDSTEKDVTKESDSLYARRDKVTIPSLKSVQSASGKARTARVRAQMLAEKVQYMRELAEANERYGNIYQKHLDAAMADLDEKYAGSLHIPEGYDRESELGLGSPTSEFKALDKRFTEHYKTQAQPRFETEIPVLKQAADFFGRVQALSRASIVLFPVVHALNNLGMHYLATGGSFERMGNIWFKDQQWSDDLKYRAGKAGATSDSSTKFFGEAGPHEAYSSTDELAKEKLAQGGPLAHVDAGIVKGTAPVKKIYDKFNKWLFDRVERGYRLDYFNRLTQTGMSDGQAAMEVNKTFGKMGDITNAEKALHLNQIFYFYPWMKTVIPFWVKKGLLDPKWWSVPVEGIKRNNEAQGYDDPSKPFTMTLGHRPNGQWRRMILPVPQRVLETVADLARAPFDYAHGDTSQGAEDLKAPVRYAAGHVNVLGSAALDLYDYARAGAKGDVAPYNLFKTDTSQPAWRQAMQFGEKAGGKFIAPFERASDLATDPVGGLSAYATGSWDYGVNTQAQNAKEKAMKEAINEMTHQAMADAIEAKDQGAIKKIRAFRDAAFVRAKAGRPSPVVPSPGTPKPLPIPSSTTPDPFAAAAR